MALSGSRGVIMMATRVTHAPLGATRLALRKTETREKDMDARSAARGRLAGMLMLLMLPAAAPAADPERDSSTQPALLQVAERGQRYTRFLDALRRTGVDQVLKGEGPFTVFAPTDAAFTAMPVYQRKVLFSPDHRAELKKMLRYHIVPGRIPPEAVDAARDPQALVQQLELEPLPSGRPGEKRRLRVNGAKTLGNGVPASNGQFYGIDKVLIPHFYTLFLPGPPPPGPPSP